MTDRLAPAVPTSADREAEAMVIPPFADHGRSRITPSRWSGAGSASDIIGMAVAPGTRWRTAAPAGGPPTQHPTMSGLMPGQPRLRCSMTPSSLSPMARTIARGAGDSA